VSLLEDVEKTLGFAKRDLGVSPDPAWRYRVGLVALTVLFAVVFFASFYLGRYPVVPGELVAVIYNGFMESVLSLFGQSWVWPEGIDRSSATVILQVRLPRVACGAFVGAALSVAGASYQGLFQNPMVSQDILGASSGAAFGASLAILLGLGSLGITSLAFFLGLLAVALAWGISQASRLSSILAMILAGMVVSALFSAATSFVKLVADTEDALPAITYWLMGSLNSVRQGDMLFAIPLILVAGIPLVLLRWRINLLATGEEEARSLGVDVRAMRLAIIVCATLLTATCVSVSGLIGWVGLIIPHFCRLAFGYDYRRLLPASLLAGATFLVAVDDVARLATTSEIPIGILTAVLGAPLFIFLMMRGGLAYGQRS
jgi:iron complex transport system permease protein